jgi:hypothetical protein
MMTKAVSRTRRSVLRSGRLHSREQVVADHHRAPAIAQRVVARPQLSQRGFALT